MTRRLHRYVFLVLLLAALVVVAPREMATAGAALFDAVVRMLSHVHIDPAVQPGAVTAWPF